MICGYRMRYATYRKIGDVDAVRKIEHNRIQAALENARKNWEAVLRHEKTLAANEGIKENIDCPIIAQKGCESDGTLRKVPRASSTHYCSIPWLFRR